jgi:porphobilinogen synthase
VSAFPATRLRRFRRTGALRELVRETRLDLRDFVYPVFACPGAGVEKPLEGLPGIAQRSVDRLADEAEELMGLGIGAVLLFGIPEEKDEAASGAYDEDGIVQQALRAMAERAPEMVLLTDVCLCEYTSHGHCGVVDGDEIVNDLSLDLLAKTAVSHAEAGAHAVCPSDMMDGRVGAIRGALDTEGFEQVPIVSYAAKAASAFYGPFREAAESAPAFGDRRSYQMDPANAREALRECELDLQEGADALMIKPAFPSLDVIAAARTRFDVPIFAYNVSGEYAMVKAAAARGWLDEPAAAIESLTAIRRAGCRNGSFSAGSGAHPGRRQLTGARMESRVGRGAFLRTPGRRRLPRGHRGAALRGLGDVLGPARVRPRRPRDRGGRAGGGGGWHDLRDADRA